MNIRAVRAFASTARRYFPLFVAAACVLLFRLTVAQELTGTLIGTVKDAQGAVLPGAVVRVISPALIGGPVMVTTNANGQLRLSALPPGRYALAIEVPGFEAFRDEEIRIGVGATIERTVVLKPAAVAESIVVEGTGSQIDARDPGFGTRFGPEELHAIPARRSSMFDAIRANPGLSPTSPSSSTVTTISAFGSGTNENQFLIDGTNFTCPCNGVARAEPGVDFIQEVQIQSAGASAEFGNVQGAVVNVVTRQGSDRFLYDASYYGQPAGLTAQPIRRPLTPPAIGESGFGRASYHDVTTNLGGPIVRERLWFFVGYQYLRDFDSQPGTDPAQPRAYESNKIFSKLTWRLAPGWQLVQSLHDEQVVSPDAPTVVTPFPATLRREASIPAITIGDLMHVSPSNTVWDVRAGRFVFSQDNMPSSGNLTTPSRTDSVTGVTTGAPISFSKLTIERTTIKAAVSHYSPGLWRGTHEWKVGSQFERGGHHAINGIPTGVRFVDANGRPSQSISTPPFNVGAVSDTMAAFASDAITLGDRTTINAGLRFDHARAFSQDLPAVDGAAHETDEIVQGLGTLYEWNLFSPRFGLTTKLTADGRTILRASYGRFRQGVLTGELEAFHPGTTPTTTSAFDSATGGYTRIVSVVNPKVNLRLDAGTRAPTTDEYSMGIDRQVGRRVAAAVAFVHKHGDDFIGWTDVGGRYQADTRTLEDGRTIPVLVLTNTTAERRFLLTNPEGYSLKYSGLVVALEKHLSEGWQLFGSYTLSRTSGLQASSGTTAAGAQVSTVAPPPSLTFGRDPNDLMNASGRLPNDRPHMVRVMGSVQAPRTGFLLAANFQYFSGKPWAATALVSLPQNNNYRVLLEQRGIRRLSSQSMLDLRISRPIDLGKSARMELMVDVLNALNDAAEEGLATDNLFAANFAQPVAFVDPRRAMLSVRFNLGR